MVLLSADSCPPGAVKLTAPPPSEPSPRCEIPPTPTQMHRWARDASLDVQIQLRMCSSASDAGRGPLLRLGPASSLPHPASSRRALRVWRGQTGWLARARASRLSNRPPVTADGPGTEKGNGASCLHRFLSVALPAQISLVLAFSVLSRKRLTGRSAGMPRVQCMARETGERHGGGERAAPRCLAADRPQHERERLGIGPSDPPPHPCTWSCPLLAEHGARCVIGRLQWRSGHVSDCTQIPMLVRVLEQLMVAQRMQSMEAPLPSSDWQRSPNRDFSTITDNNPLTSPRITIDSILFDLGCGPNKSRK